MPIALFKIMLNKKQAALLFFVFLHIQGREVIFYFWFRVTEKDVVH